MYGEQRKWSGDLSRLSAAMPFLGSTKPGAVAERGKGNFEKNNL